MFKAIVLPSSGNFNPDSLLAFNKSLVDSRLPSKKSSLINETTSVFSISIAITSYGSNDGLSASEAVSLYTGVTSYIEGKSV